MFHQVVGDATRIQTIPFYISNPLRSLVLVMKDDLSTASSSAVGDQLVTFNIWNQKY